MGIFKVRQNKKNVCAVGTTVMRTLESSVSTQGFLKPYEGWTNKFIFPPYEFSVANSMITNFHLPYSTLLMMVAAFGGYDFVMEAYRITSYNVCYTKLLRAQMSVRLSTVLPLACSGLMYDAVPRIMPATVPAEVSSYNFV